MLSLQAAEINVTIQGVDNTDGKLIVRLFDSADGFPKQPAQAIRTAFIPISENKALTTFSDLPPGTYAIAAAHDSNDNGKLDFGLFGTPKEGIGFSRDAPAKLGPPGFDDAIFELGDDNKTLTIKMRY